MDLCEMTFLEAFEAMIYSDAKIRCIPWNENRLIYLKNGALYDEDHDSTVVFFDEEEILSKWMRVKEDNKKNVSDEHQSIPDTITANKKSLSLSEALDEMLKNGKKIRLEHWPKNRFINVKNGALRDQNGVSTCCTFNLDTMTEVWEIFKEKRRFNFIEAVKLIKENKKLTRPSFNTDEQKIHICQEQASPGNLVKCFNDRFGVRVKVIWVPSIEDVIATDWYEVV